MKTLEQANKSVDAARIVYRNYIRQYCDQCGSMRSASLGMDRSPDYVEKILSRDEFSENIMSLRKLANNINDRY